MLYLLLTGHVSACTSCSSGSQQGPNSVKLRGCDAVGALAAVGAAAASGLKAFQLPISLCSTTVEEQGQGTGISSMAMQVCACVQARE
jgi:hypothetical protein